VNADRFRENLFTLKTPQKNKKKKLARLFSVVSAGHQHSQHFAKVDDETRLNLYRNSRLRSVPFSGIFYQA
jgi:hypothetical protein